MSLLSTQPCMDGVDSLLQLRDAAHVIDDDRCSTAFIDQWHLCVDSLLSRCDVKAGTIAESLALHFLLTAVAQKQHFGAQAF